MQHRIVTPGPLHDEKGRLIETGYATSLVKTYDSIDASQIDAFFSRLQLQAFSEGFVKVAPVLT